MTRTSLGVRLRAAAVTITMSAGLLATSAAVTAPSASASTYAPRGSWNWKVAQVMRQAGMQKGKPYRFGSTGPSAFDCSGLVQFVYKRALGQRLPRTAAAQYHASKHIRRSSLRVGDLVFVTSGGSISHVGIYAGNGYWWVAPHSGSRVKKQKIYTSHVIYGRVIH